MKFPRRQFVCSLIGLALVPFTRRRKPKPTEQPVQVVGNCHLNVDAFKPVGVLHMPPDGVVLWNGKPVDLNDIPPDLHVYLKHHPAKAEVFWKIADRCRKWSNELALGRAMRH